MQTMVSGRVLAKLTEQEPHAGAWFPLEKCAERLGTSAQGPATRHTANTLLQSSVYTSRGLGERVQRKSAMLLITPNGNATRTRSTARMRLRILCVAFKNTLHSVATETGHKRKRIPVGCARWQLENARQVQECSVQEDVTRNMRTSPDNINRIDYSFSVLLVGLLFNVAW